MSVVERDDALQQPVGAASPAPAALGAPAADDEETAATVVSAARFTLLGRLGDGAFSEVHLAADAARGGARVALKRVFLRAAGRQGLFPVAAFREAAAHAALARVPRVVRARGHYVHRGMLVLVLPAYATDLAGVLDAAARAGAGAGADAGAVAEADAGADAGGDAGAGAGVGGGGGGGGGGGAGAGVRRGLPLPAARALARDVLTGLAGMHAAGVMHRDVKPGNVLVAEDGRADLSDLGLARPFYAGATGAPAAVGGVAPAASGDARYTAQVTSRWYRAPELLLGAAHYGPAVDAWAAGALLAELLCGAPLAPGASDVEQLSRVFAARGTPDAAAWPGLDALPDWGKLSFEPRAPPPVRALLLPRGAAGAGEGRDAARACEHACELVGGLLELNPAARATPARALAARWLAPGGCGCGGGDGGGEEDEARAAAAVVAAAVAAREAAAAAAAAARAARAAAAHERGAEVFEGGWRDSFGDDDDDDDWPLPSDAPPEADG